MKLSELTDHLYKMLDIASWSDLSLNGVQVEAPDKEVKKVACAVDASMETIEKAIEQGCDMLFVHHGFFWGKPIAISGNHYKRIKACLDNELCIYACHLPLDAHPIYGNNAQMCMSLGMESYDPFGEYKGKSIGFKGKLPMPMTVSEIARLLDFKVTTGLRILPFGKERCETVGIISGGAGWDVLDAIDEGLDCYITGEAPHEIFHAVKESGMNMIAGGHYRSEVFGPKAIMRYIKGAFGIETVWIDADTGL